MVLARDACAACRRTIYVQCAGQALGGRRAAAHQRDRTALGGVADEVAHQLLHRSARELGPLELLKASELLLGSHLNKLLIQLTARHGGALSGRCLVGSTVRAQRSVRTPSCPSRSALSAVLASRRPLDPLDDASPPHPRSDRPHRPPRPCLAPCASTSRMNVLGLRGRRPAQAPPSGATGAASGLHSRGSG